MSIGRGGDAGGEKKAETLLATNYRKKRPPKKKQKNNKAAKLKGKGGERGIRVKPLLYSSIAGKSTL